MSLYLEDSIIFITSLSFNSYKSFLDILFSSLNLFRISAINCIEYLVLSSRYITDNLLVTLTKFLAFFLVLNPNSISFSSLVCISISSYISLILARSNSLYINRAFDNEYSNLSADNLGVSLSAIGYKW